MSTALNIFFYSYYVESSRPRVRAFWENLPKPALKRHVIVSIQIRSSVNVARPWYTNLFEPHDGKHDVGERGHLFDVDHLANGQIDLYSGLGSHGDSHFLWTRDKHYSRILSDVRGETIVVGKGQPGETTHVHKETYTKT